MKGNNPRQLFAASNPMKSPELPLYVHNTGRKRSRAPWLLAVTIISFLLLLCTEAGRRKCVTSDDSNHTPGSLGGPRNPAYLIKAHHGAVAAENKRCSDIGVDVLKEGGNAVDAAISAAFCTGVVNMFS